MLMVVSVTIRLRVSLWRNMNSLKYPPGKSIWSNSLRHSSGDVGPRSRAKCILRCRARARWRTRGEAHAIASGYALAHSPM
jgi:hypothetical protein